MEISQKVETKKGGFRTMPFIIANETIEKVASYGLHSNMILYLENEYHMGTAKGASILFLWNAASNFLPITGAFLSDSYLGRFNLIGIGTVVSLKGMILLWQTAIFPKARPPHCDLSAGNCASANAPQLMLLYSSFVLMAIGSGGIRPCSLAFGADQLYKPHDPNNEKLLQSFFNWYYASVGISIMISVLLIVYIQNVAGWIVGFGVPVGLMFFSMAMFFLGSPLYVKVKANKSMFSGFARVIVVAWRNKHLTMPESKNHNQWYYEKGSKLVAPTDSYRFLNKACFVKNPEKDLNSEGLVVDPWRLCTVKHVEELKALIRVLPIWSTGIVISVAINQHSFSTLQASTMKRRIGAHFDFPAASFGVFTLLTLTIWVAIYDRVLVPWLSRFTNRARGLSFKQRMGIGLAISCLASFVSGEVERRRRSIAIRDGLSDHPHAIVNMSAMWLVPQHCLAGLAEAFNAIGQIEFYYSQFPKSMASIAVALFSLGLAVGSLFGALIINIVNDVTKKDGNGGWLSDNLNKGRYDYYYWFLAVLGVINLLYFIVCSYSYGCCETKRIWDEEGDKEIELPSVT